MHRKIKDIFQARKRCQPLLQVRLLCKFVFRNWWKLTIFPRQLHKIIWRQFLWQTLKSNTPSINGALGKNFEP